MGFVKHWYEIVFWNEAIELNPREQINFVEFLEKF